jgi:type II secretory pathway pseudopilin PulG
MITQSRHRTHARPAQGGFTLVELMVTVGIALFLLGGLVTIMQNVRQANLTQGYLNSLLDEQRFALTVMADAIQVGGYIADPLGTTSSTWPAIGLFPQGAAFAGQHSPAGVVPDSTATDTIFIRFQTVLAAGSPYGTGPILCNGTDSSTLAAATYTIGFRVVPGPGPTNGLQCSVDGGNSWVTIVPGVQALAIYYGVNRGSPGADYNIDTYVTADNLVNPNDFLTISAVRIAITFLNPLYVAGGPQPQLITVERVVQVMNRAGVVT